MADIVINLDKVSVSLGGRPIFSELSWELQNRQRVGLVGPNGVGKSTLLKLIATELPADDGNIFRQSGLTWGRLEQEPALTSGKTVLAEAMTAVPQLAILEEEMAHLEARMGDPDVYS
ncbi:MAG: ABC-F family ATP-binding cassette domain-containing protein, partial [Anaerolineales bacterium]|nr:ABC-F family ATP-binding cassette domain-containing protein [Anaerolineales bacterium]